MSTRFTVRAGACDYRSAGPEVYETLRRITDPLSRSWTRLERAQRIVIKTNMVWWPEKIRTYEGYRQELVDDRVFRAVLRLLKERTSAQLVVADTSYFPPDERPGPDVYFLPLLKEYGVTYREASLPPLKLYDVPDGGLMFSRYLLSSCFDECDAVVSVSKMKSHAYMGVTLCLKNLFGFAPTPPHGRDRIYFHHIIRLPHVLADLGRIIRPDLNIIDGLVAQSNREWGGEVRVANALVAGDHVIATDACGAWLMGHDPSVDWPAPPFRRDRNAILVAAESGFGTVDFSDIDFESEVDRLVAAFDSDQPDPHGVVENWRRTMCEQALYYRDHRQELAERYEGEYIYLQDGRVVWHGLDPRSMGSRRHLSGDDKYKSLFLKWVDPQEEEGEHFDIYEKIFEVLGHAQT